MKRGQIQNSAFTLFFCVQASSYIKCWFCLLFMVIWFEKLISWKPLLTVCLQVLILPTLKAPNLYYWKGLYLVLGFNKIVYHIFLLEHRMKMVWVLSERNRFIIQHVCVWLLNRQEGKKMFHRNMNVQWSNHTKSSQNCPLLDPVDL